MYQVETASTLDTLIPTLLKICSVNKEGLEMDSTPTPHDQYGLANIAIILGQATVLNKANSGNTATYFTATTKRAHQTSSDQN